MFAFHEGFLQKSKQFVHLFTVSYNCDNSNSVRLELSAISNSNPFPFPLFFSHLLSDNSNPRYLELYFWFPWEFELAGVYFICFDFGAFLTFTNNIEIQDGGSKMGNPRWGIFYMYDIFGVI